MKRYSHHIVALLGLLAVAPASAQVLGNRGGITAETVQSITQTEVATQTAALRATIETAAPVALYVETAGSDASACTAPGTPCATIQGALDKVARIQLRHPVNVYIGAGTFAPAWVQTPLLDQSLRPAGSYINIQGTLANSTGVTGAVTGTVTSATAAADNPHAVVTVTGAGWTAGQLRGRFFRLTAGSGSNPAITAAYTIFTIEDNTADTITLAGYPPAMDTTTAFAIQDSVTTISGTQTIPSAPLTDFTGLSQSYGIVVTGESGAYSQASVTIQRIRFTGFTYNIYIKGFANLRSVNNQFVAKSSGTCIGHMFLFASGTAEVRDSSMMGSSPNGALTLMDRSVVSLLSRGTVVDGSETHVLDGTGSVISQRDVSFNTPNGVFRTRSCYQGAPAIIVNGLRMSGGAFMMRVNCGAVANISASKLDSVQGSVILNENAYALFITSGLAGTGNGNLVTATHGEVQWHSTNTITGSGTAGEVKLGDFAASVTNTTITDLRAATPKLKAATDGPARITQRL